ncbi:MAG TPA: hypothetical protein VFA46_12990 [Actinomycetes bacterium]|jgi:hypothetical protein|nr:hypothetical protein [Actinomycetes bacterium]
MKTTRARANVLLAAAAWTLYVWVTRMWNIARDPAHDFGFKAVHAALAVVSVAFAVALAVIGLRMRREAAAARPGPESSGQREPVGR